jgi:tetratricopeptide (TPR) repeat protein
MAFKNSFIKPFVNIRFDILVCLFIVMAVLAVYGQVRNHEFIGLDDDRYVFENATVKNGLTLDGVIWAFKSIHVSNWHPLTWLSHMLDVQLYGMNPASHHLTNVLFHILNTLLLFFILRRMTGELWRSSFVAVLFALHPLHVESVAWVAERKDVLSTFFWMLTLWGYARYVEQPGVYRYLLVLTFFILGLLAKPMVITLPFVLLLLDFWPLDRLQSVPKSGIDRYVKQKPSAVLLILEKTPLFLLAAVSSIVTLQAQQSGGAVGSLVSYPLSVRISNALVSYTGYIGKMIWPEKLAVFYPHPGIWSWWQLTGAGLLIVSIFFLGVWWSRKYPWFLVGWLWYMGTLVPVSGLIQVGTQAMADRYTYIPLIGLFLIVAWGGPEIWDQWRFSKRSLTTLSVAILLCLSIITSLQVRYWKNSVTLFEHALDVTTNNYIMHNNLGFELARQGQANKALWHYKEALRINPVFELANLNLGVLLLSQGKINECIQVYREALKLEPGFARVHVNLGNMLLRQGMIDNAVVHFQEALRIKHDYAEAHNSLGAAMLFKGNNHEASNRFREALRIKPDLSAARNNLNKILAAPKKK